MAVAHWTPAAEQDLESIFLFIGREQHSTSAATKVLRDIIRKADDYAEHPLLAAARPEFGLTIRAFYSHRYVVLYRPDALGIQILRVIHGSRDVFRVFSRDEQ